MARPRIAIPTERKCAGPCQQSYPFTLANYGPAKFGVGGLSSWCRSCARDRQHPEPPAERECKACGKTYPLDAEHFFPAKDCKFGLEPNCKVCSRTRRNEHKTSARKGIKLRKAYMRPLKPGEICGECFDLPHRVEGEQCFRCGLEYAPEPPVDVRDYLYRLPELSAEEQAERIRDRKHAALRRQA